ncbi:MAG: hypothetical protein AB8G05_13500 [Oligoflexales bacterium]
MKFIMFLGFLLPVNSWGSAGENCYRTPAKAKNRPQSAEVVFDSPDVKAIIREVDLLENTPEGHCSQDYARFLIDEQDSEQKKTAARMRRHLKRKFDNPIKVSSPIKKAWIEKYQRIRANSSRGILAENCALQSFGVSNNNYGESLVFSQTLSPTRTGESAVYQITRPDGVAEDADGSRVVFESKLLSCKRGVLYASRQIRAQEESARQNNCRHVVVITTVYKADEVENFPVPSSTFKSKNLLSEFRLIDAERNVYRWSSDDEAWDIVE